VKCCPPAVARRGGGGAGQIAVTVRRPDERSEPSRGAKAVRRSVATVERPVLAVDVGGTKMATGVVDPAGSVVGAVEVPTPAADGEELFAALRAAVDRSLAAAALTPAELAAIGVGCGGPMRYPEGEVSPLNIPGWRRFPLRARLAAAYDRPVVVDNDAKAMALGEHWRGAGQGARCLLGMVVSTGVGGGIVVAGRLLHGAHGNAGHVGHVVVEPGGPRCPCGARGCVEAIASGPSIVRLARAALARGAPSALRGRERLTAAEVAAAARAGDPLAVALFARAGRALGRGIASAAALLDLDRVVIGGGVSQVGPLLFAPLRAELDRRARLDFTRGLAVEPAGLGRLAGLVGAAALVLSGAGEG
jgi:glucokinase